MNLKRISISTIVILSLFFSWAAYYTGKKDSNIAQYLKSILPNNTKTFLKKTIFAVRVNSIKVDEHFIRIKKLEKQIDTLKSQVAIQNKFASTKLPLLDKKILKIISDNSDTENVVNLYNYQLPFPNYETQLAKPVAYIDQYEDFILIVTGNGRFFKFKKKEISAIKKSFVLFESIKTNIEDVVDKWDHKEFYEPGFDSVKDILVIGDKILVSYNSKKKEDCFNTEILIADLNIQDSLMFDRYFSYNECATSGNNQHGGGRMVKLKNGNIALTIGDYGFRDSAQDDNSMFGKIIIIDKEDQKKYTVQGTGSRNAQGLVFLPKQNALIHTEHGPIGGDEMNVTFLGDDKIENFGWPKASYGELADGTKIPNNHEKIGFTEPIKYYTPAIGISEVKHFNKENLNENPLILLSSMGWADEEYEGDRSLQILELDKKLSKVLEVKRIPVNQRVRDMIILDDSISKQKTVITVLENSPSLAVITF
jgi:hypothetical protein